MTDRDPRLDSAYRASPREEPPRELDERIRAAARRAVAAGPQTLEARAQGETARSWIARWRVPMSVAATVLVAVTLSYMVQEEEARRVPIDGPPSAAPAPAQVAPASAAPPRADVQSGPPVDERPARAQPPTAAPVLREKRAPAEAQAPAPAPAPPAKLEPPPTAGAASNELEKRRADIAAPAAPAIQAAPAAPAAPAPIAPAAKPAPFSGPTTRAAPSGEAAEPLGRDRAAADRPGRMERGVAAPAAAEAKSRTPEAWVEEIRRLKAQGRTAEAAAELAEFRKRYPDYKLPADLLP